MSKRNRSKWNFSITHNGEKGLLILSGIFTILGIVFTYILHNYFHFQVLAASIISFVLFGIIITTISIVLGCIGKLT